MFIVTGAAGFIGSNLVAALNARGTEEILAVDEASDGAASANLAHLCIADYCTKEELLQRLAGGRNFAASLTAVFHEGACSSTVESDEDYLMSNNFEYSRRLLDFCLEHSVPFQYASTAGVYGHNHASHEIPVNEAPATAYARSKLAFDQYVRPLLKAAKAPLTGLRYFNVYGPGEAHKGFMCSVPYRFDGQLLKDGKVRVFGANAVCAAGEHRRDFVHVDDIVQVKLWCFEQAVSGIFNVGTGHSRTFREAAERVIAWHGHGTIEYIPFPEQLEGAYQNFTQADLTQLRAAGYKGAFMPIEQGIPRYLETLNPSRPAGPAGGRAPP